MNSMEDKNNSEFKLEYISTSGVYKTPFTLVILLQLFVGSCILVLANICKEVISYELRQDFYEIVKNNKQLLDLKNLKHQKRFILKLTEHILKDGVVL